MPNETATVAVIGGSGLYALLDGADDITMDTPYGPPSSPVTIADVGGTFVAFIARHGRHHEIPPHRINYRANAWALAQLGVRRVIAPAAVGGLAAELVPGDLVVPDQIVDWTGGRVQTFHDTFDGPPVHAAFADPYCSVTRTLLLEVAASHGWQPVDGGAMVVIDGPRFSSRAESRFFAGQGWTIINMTGHPEAVLCRELGMCYAALALVTDLDAGVRSGDGVTVAAVLAEFGRNTERLRAVLIDAAGRAGALMADSCAVS